MAKAQKGDLIRVTYVDTANGHYEASYRIGDILEVAQYHNVGEIDSENDCVKTTEGHVLYNHEYEIHRKAGEEDSDGIDEQDAINSPNHYTQGRFEVIDVIEDAVVGADPFEAVCQANILKYTLRYRHKNGVEDLKKARWYLEKLISVKEVSANVK